MKIIVLIVIFAALGGWYRYDKYGEELFPASEEVAYVDPRLEELETVRGGLPTKSLQWQKLTSAERVFPRLWATK